MKLTTKTIIKMLPFDDVFKTELSNGVDLLDPDRKFVLERILWQTYDILYGLKLQENYELGMLRVKNRQEKLDKEFYKRVEEKTEKEMENETLKTTEKVDLEAARKAMEKIVREMQAAGKTQ